MARHFGILKNAAIRQREWHNPEAPMDDVNGDFPFPYTPDPDPDRDANHAFWKVGAGIIAVFAGVFLGLAVLLVACSAAKAHDHDQPDLDLWFRQQYSVKGACCDGSEAHHIADVDWDSTCVDGKCHYRVMLFNKWWSVDDSAVVAGPNLSGTALVWMSPWRQDDEVIWVSIHCFMPGAGG
jgi:hypothetical protein